MLLLMFTQVFAKSFRYGLYPPRRFFYTAYYLKLLQQNNNVGCTCYLLREQNGFLYRYVFNAVVRKARFFFEELSVYVDK